MIIPRSVLLRIKNDSDKIIKKIATNILFPGILFFIENRGVYEITKRRQMTILRTRIAYCMPKFTDTNTHSEYAVHIIFPLLQWAPESGSL